MAMRFQCLFGHYSSSGRYGEGLSSGPCDACGRLLVRRLGGRWYEMPRGYTLDWSTSGQHAISPNDLLRIARRKTPTLHRLRRRPYRFGGYFSDDGNEPARGPWINFSEDTTKRVALARNA
jgi:hypothetical protein